MAAIMISATAGRPNTQGSRRVSRGTQAGAQKKKSLDKEPDMASLQSELDEMSKEQLERTATINENGKSRKIKMIEVIARAQINIAAKGNVYAQREVLKTKREIEQRDAVRAILLQAQQAAERQEEVETYHAMVGYKKRREAEWAEPVARRTEPDNPWPHPDDILLFPSKQCWRPREPFDAADLTFYNYCRAERDYLLANSTLESRTAKLHSKCPLEPVYDRLGALRRNASASLADCQRPHEQQSDVRSPPHAHQAASKTR
jgi:hypothetical protein